MTIKRWDGNVVKRDIQGWLDARWQEKDELLRNFAEHQVSCTALDYAFLLFSSMAYMNISFCVSMDLQHFMGNKLKMDTRSLTNTKVYSI